MSEVLYRSARKSYRLVSATQRFVCFCSQIPPRGIVAAPDTLQYELVTIEGSTKNPTHNRMCLIRLQYCSDYSDHSTEGRDSNKLIACALLLE